MAIFLLQCWPFENRISTLIAVLNEVTATWMLAFMLSYTDWVPNVELRYQTGWVLIGAFCLNLFVHILILLNSLKDAIRSKCFKFKNISAETAWKQGIQPQKHAPVLAAVQEQSEGDESPEESSSQQSSPSLLGGDSSNIKLRGGLPNTAIDSLEYESQLEVISRLE